jgi:hypothetical protein
MATSNCTHLPNKATAPARLPGAALAAATSSRSLARSSSKRREYLRRAGLTSPCTEGELDLSCPAHFHERGLTPPGATASSAAAT